MPSEDSQRLEAVVKDLKPTSTMPSEDSQRLEAVVKDLKSKGWAKAEVLAEVERFLGGSSPIRLPRTPDQPRPQESRPLMGRRPEQWSSGARHSPRPRAPLPAPPESKLPTPKLPSPQQAEAAEQATAAESFRDRERRPSFDDVLAALEMEEKETQEGLDLRIESLGLTATEALEAVQWKQSLVSFTQMLWSFDLDATLQGFLGSEVATKAYLAFLEPGADAHAKTAARSLLTLDKKPAARGLERGLETADSEAELAAATPQLAAGRLLAEADASIDSELFGFVLQVAAVQQQQEAASTRAEHDVVRDAERALAVRYAKLLGSPPREADSPLGEVLSGTTREHLAQMAADGLAVLSGSPLLEAFVTSPMSRPLIHQLLRVDTMASDRRSLEQEARELLWQGYDLPPDAAGWLIALASVGETLPACFVISDMTIPGNPMIYVNREFCRVTGYSKSESQGQNCRFLQGPRTEPEAVAAIQDTLRRGVDCHVRITNYRKSGETFSNLLMLRPVRDAGAPNGPCRFCFGVQFEVTRSRSGMDARLHRLSRLMTHLPAFLPAMSDAPAGSGAVHLQRAAAVAPDDASERERLPMDAAGYMHRMNAALSGA